MRKKLLYWLGFLDFVLVVLAVLLFTFDKTGLVIAVGIKAANTLVNVGKIAVLALFVAVNALGLWRFWKLKPAAPKAGSPEVSASKPKLWEMRMTDPNEIRKELLVMVERRPELKAEIQKATQQMDDLYRKEGQLQEVARRDLVKLMGAAVETLRKAEAPILENVVRILSYAEVFSRDPQLQAQNRQRILKHLDSNDRILKLCDEVLTKAVDYGGGKTNQAFDTLDLTATLDSFDQKLAVIGKKD